MSTQLDALDTGERPDAVPGRGHGLRGHPWWTLISVALGVIMVGLDGTVVAVANPHIAADLHASLSDLQWITNAYLLALAALLILGGKLGDRFGRRLIFLIGVVGFGAVSVGIGLIGSTTGVIVLRVLQGVFGAMLMPNTLAILRAAFPAEKLNAAIGIWGGASAVSVAFGPIVGGLLVEHVSWESVFYINAPIAVIALIVGCLVIKESRSEASDNRLDFPGIVTLSGGLFLIVFGLIKAQEWGWGDGKTLGFIIGGLAVLAVFVLIELRSSHPLLPMRLFKNRSLSLGTVVVLINFLALFGVLFFITLYLQNVQGLSAVDAGVRTLPMSLAMMACSPIGGLVTQKFGARAPMAGGLIAVVAGLALLSTLQADSSYNHLWPSMLLLGLGIGFVTTASSDAIVGNAGVNDAGIAGGLQSTAVQFGGVMGTAIFGSVLSSQVGSVLVDKLTGAGTPPEVANQLSGAKEIVSQGVAPVTPAMSQQVAEAVTTGSHEAFMTGLQTSIYAALGVAVLGVIAALFVKSGPSSAGATVVAH